MYYKAELEFLVKVLKRMHLQVSLICPGEICGQQLDFGLRKFLGREEDYERAFSEAVDWAKVNTIYKLTDEFMCNYLFLLLPQSPEMTALIVGPYMSFELTREQLLEEAERYGVPAWRCPQLEGYYSNIPVILDEAPLATMLNVFGETLWGPGNAFEFIDINRELTSAPALIHPGNEGDDQEDIAMRMKVMETRYTYENELMETVSQGLSHRAELMLASFSTLTFEQRMADPIRNMKNYSIICNTLLRKAAEQGGVHPIYLDSVSSEFAKRIEGVMNFEKGQELMAEMVRSYCRLVRKHSMKHYSPLVQKVVTYIETDISADLSLRALAAAQNINASYLSGLFKKETGKTITEYVNEKRMEDAARMLRSTKLQIQTVAQHCGMSDVNYFSKVFKKHHGLTPKQFREEARPYLQQRGEKKKNPDGERPGRG